MAFSCSLLLQVIALVPQIVLYYQFGVVLIIVNFRLAHNILINPFNFSNHIIESTLFFFSIQDEKCHFNKSDVGADDTGYVTVKSGDEDALKMAVGTVGPISVAIDAGHSSFAFYNGGVYVEPDCSTTFLDHGVLAVGYGTTEEGQDYWLVKNRLVISFRPSKCPVAGLCLPTYGLSFLFFTIHSCP